MKFNKLILLLTAMMLLSMGHSAEIYRWVDENGKVHYSDKPPKGAKKKAQQVIIDSTPEVAKKDTVARSASDRMAAANQWLSSTREKKEEKVAERDQAYQKKQQRIRDCKVLKRELKDFQNADVVYDYDENGERFYLSEQERDKLIHNIKQKMTQTCEE